MPAYSPTQIFYDAGTPLVRLAWHEPLPGTEVPEAVVQEIWKAQRLRPARLRTTSGEPVEVLHPGELNADGGPDFRFARIRIGDTVWFGDVEVHTTSRGWRDHAHDADPAYNSVVLHVVLQPDLWSGTLHRADGTALPELVLAPHLDGSFRERLVHFFTRPAPNRPCHWGFHEMPLPQLQDWLRACATERLERRARAFADPYPFAERLYRAVAAALGYRPNSTPMERLAERVALSDLRILRSTRDREALLLGMAGLLPAKSAQATFGHETERAYCADLCRRFEALRPCTPAPMVPTEWQYARLRPANFPELRVAQLAALVAPTGLFNDAGLEQSRALLCQEATEADFHRLLDAPPDPFWTTHYRFDRGSRPHTSAVGTATRRRLLVNVLLPAMLAASGFQARVRLAALDLMARMPAEDDRLTRSFSFPARWTPSLLDTQGLHELDRRWCARQRCLSCEVGRHLLTRAAVFSEHHSASPACSSGSSTSTSGPNP